MAHTVHKFSSEILKSASDIRKLVSIIPKTNSICVVSGLGETNTLFRELVKSAGQGNQEKALFIFEQIKQAHLAIANELNIPPRHLESCFIELNNRLRIIISSSERVYNEDYDAIVSYASILATTIIARYANLPIIDALKVIKTDGQFNNAKIDVDLSLKLFSEQLVNQSCFVAGNIGSDQKNRPTTFNVHGSNYTAATLAAFVKANEIVIWTSKNGISVIKDKLIPDSLHNSKIDYDGISAIVHVNPMIFSRYTFNIIQQNKLKIHIRNLYDQRNDGTYITATTTAPYLLINEFSNLSMVNFDRLIKIPDLETIPYSLAANDHSSIIINGNLIDQINKIFNSISHHFVANIYTVFITSNCLSERVFNQLIKTLEEQKLSPLTYQLNTRKNLSVLVFDQSVNKQKAIEIIYHHLISIIQQ